MNLTFITGAAATLFAIAGAFFTGFDYGKKTVVVKQEVAVLGDWQRSFDAATQVASDFQKLAADYVAKLNTQNTTNQARSTAAKAVTHARPLTATLDPQLVQLRCAAIQDLYAAAGREVSGGCVPGPAPAAPPAKQPAR